MVKNQFNSFTSGTMLEEITKSYEKSLKEIVKIRNQVEHELQPVMDDLRQ